jgi:hypothetical protein
MVAAAVDLGRTRSSSEQTSRRSPRVARPAPAAAEHPFARPSQEGEIQMRYMLLIYGQEAAPGEGVSMPDMEPWNAYTQWMIDTGIYKAGDPLAPSTAATTVRVQDGRRLTTDGPFAETKEVLGGYYIVDCPDLDTALEAAGRCPGATDGSIEVRPILDMDLPETAGAGAAS